MGTVFSVLARFRKKTSTKEILEQLEEDIESLESTLQRNREQQKTVVLSLLMVSAAVYLCFAGIFYMWYMPKKWSERLLWFLPFLAFPILVFFLKRLLHFIFVTRISRNSKSLDLKKKEKQKILENVMETETYKVAKEILEKFDPSRKLVERDTPIKDTPGKPLQTPLPGQELRQRNVPPGSMPTPRPVRPGGMPIVTPQGLPYGTPAMRIPTPGVINGGMVTPAPVFRHGTPNFRAAAPHLPNAPILPRDRSFFDKVAEYFVGDGPSNRYALICKQCYSHNGMALVEEFEYIAYKCCYCGTLNPARKSRPIAPPSFEHDSSALSSGIASANEGSSDESTAENTDNIRTESSTDADKICEVDDRKADVTQEEGETKKNISDEDDEGSGNTCSVEDKKDQ